MTSHQIPVPKAGKLLVATPELADPHFSHTVVLLLAVQNDGVLGVVLNRPSEMPVVEVMPEWASDVTSPSVLFQGGPVGIDSVIGLTPSGAINLHKVDEIDFGDLELRLFAGSAGWGSAQLQGEIAQGCWWVFDAEPDDVTTQEPATLWSRVLARQSGRIAWFAHATANPAFN